MDVVAHAGAGLAAEPGEVGGGGDLDVLRVSGHEGGGDPDRFQEGHVVGGVGGRGGVGLSQQVGAGGLGGLHGPEAGAVEGLGCPRA